MSKLFIFAQAKGKWHKFTSFNLGGGAKLYKNFAQKLLAVSLCTAVVLMAVPLGGQGVHIAEAADPVTTIPVKMFAEPKDLIDSNNFSLATDDTTKVGKISFGTRPGEVKYYKNDWDTPYSVGTPGTPTPITWLIAGSDATDGLVLYSEEPLVSAYTLRDASSKMNSKFQPTYSADGYGDYWVGSSATQPAFDSSWGAYPTSPANVYANHWGASTLRQVLTAIYNGTTLTVDGEEADYSGFFNATEKDLMAASTIKTNDHQFGSAVEYTTMDYLYAPRLDSRNYSYLTTKSVTVGGADSLTIDTAHWGARSWLRSPHPGSSYGALIAPPGDAVSNSGVDAGVAALSAAFRLNLSSVLFTSAASAASSAEGGKFSKISADTPMTLRVHKYLPDFTGTATLNAKDTITVNNAAEGDVLMVQGVTDEGENWSYSKKMGGTGSATVTAGDVVAAGASEITGFALSDFSNCNIWLERTTGEEGCTVTFASTPIVAGAGEASPSACTPEAVSQLDATCTEPGHAAHYKCSVCGQLYSDAEGKTSITMPTAIPATGHNSSGAWQKDETHHWKVCGACSEKIENAEHTWDGGTVTTQPTTSAPGVKTYKCSVCGQTKTETIPKLDAETGGGDGGPDGPTDGPVWGTPDLTVFDTFPQYVNEAGRTSRVLESGALDDRGILWLKETSDNTSAWYGLDLSTGAFDLDGQTAFYIQWLSPKDPEYNTYYSQLDDAQKARVEDDNGWIFLIGVEDSDGNKVQPSHPVNVYVQIGDDWDLDQLKAYFISAAADSPVAVEDVHDFPYPEGTDEFGLLTLSHFSPYFIFDELTDEERTLLGIPSTGDISTELLLSGLAIVIVSSLGVMLRLITSKKKFEE